MKDNNISEKVKNIREQYGLIGTAVDPLIITEEIGIKVLEKSNLAIDSQPVSGAIIKNNSDITIYVNSEDNKNRKRFTVAHEIAHYYLHLDRSKQFVDLKRNNSRDLLELEADEFAGCLLMDENQVRERFNKAKSIGLKNDGIVSVLAGIFVVSNSAMYTRLKRLELL